MLCYSDFALCALRDAQKLWKYFFLVWVSVHGMGFHFSSWYKGQALSYAIQSKKKNQTKKNLGTWSPVRIPIY